jgi:Glycosyltransferase family 25 (LPS biosynthesis protein)
MTIASEQGRTDTGRTDSERGAAPAAQLRSEAHSATSNLPAYVVSLRDAQERRRNMAARLAAAGIAFRFVDAIDGRSQRLPDVFDGARVVRQGFYSESALGAAMSHRLVHRMIADGESDLALVLEDDAKLAPDIIEVLAAAPSLEFDLLKLEGGPRRRRTVVGRIGRYSLIIGMMPSMGAAAYLIRRSAAARFCALPVLDQEIDSAFGDFRLSLRVLELDPYAVIQDRETPTLVSFQQYPPGFRRGLNFWGRLALPWRKRGRVLRLHGIRVALALELQKFRS